MNPTWLAFFLILQGRNTKSVTGNKALTSTMVTAMSPPLMRLPLAVVASKMVEDERALAEKTLADEFRAVMAESARVKGPPAADFLSKSAPQLSAIQVRHPGPVVVTPAAPPQPPAPPVAPAQPNPVK